MWLGDGENAEKYIAREPTAKWVPRGVAHNPWIVTKVDNPKYPIIIQVIALTHTYSIDANITKDFALPPAFSMDKIGQEQPGKGLYTKYFNRMLPSQTIVIPHLRGRVSVPNLMFDDTVYRAPVWVEIFHVFAGGSGVGIPTLEPQPIRDGTLRDNRQGMQHAQNYDELFLFLSADPHDILNLGGEVETWLGDEKYSITKSSAVWVPAGTPHNPQYYKKVDQGRSYFMVVIALCDNGKFFEGVTDTWPAPKAFKM
jgi:mannose-6-phosphate isomerase-like protein (cupin superfamily)